MRRLCAVVILAIALRADATAAQRPFRSGFWFETGTGRASLRISCSGCTGVTRGHGTTGMWSAGGAVSSHVLLGVESVTIIDRRLGFSSDDSLVADNSAIAPVVIWYPTKYGLFLKGGIGVATGTFTVDPNADPKIVADGTGVGMTFGAGYDVPISRRFSFTLTAGSWVTAIGDVVLPTRRIDDVIATLYAATITFTIR